LAFFGDPRRLDMLIDAIKALPWITRNLSLSSVGGVCTARATLMFAAGTIASRNSLSRGTAVRCWTAETDEV
jgi:hypothetical protein